MIRRQYGRLLVGRAAEMLRKALGGVRHGGDQHGRADRTRYLPQGILQGGGVGIALLWHLGEGRRRDRRADDRYA